MADRIAVMNKGTLIQIDTKKHIFENPRDEVNKIIWNTTEDKEIIKKSAIFFDSLYEKVLKKNEKRNAY